LFLLNIYIINFVDFSLEKLRIFKKYLLALRERYLKAQSCSCPHFLLFSFYWNANTRRCSTISHILILIFNLKI